MAMVIYWENKSGSCNTCSAPVGCRECEHDWPLGPACALWTFSPSFCWGHAKYILPLASDWGWQGHCSRLLSGRHWVMWQASWGNFAQNCTAARYTSSQSSFLPCFLLVVQAHIAVWQLLDQTAQVLSFSLSKVSSKNFLSFLVSAACRTGTTTRTDHFDSECL